MSEHATPADQDRKATSTATDDAAVQPCSDTPAAAGRYQLLHELARGGMGVVYRAADTALGREVAVKVLQERYAPDSAVGRRFLDEARIAGQLQHPGVPAVHDLGTLADGRPFLAMRLIKGRTLDALLRGQPDPAQGRGRLVAVFEQVCQAVGYAHAHGVIHRDLKPGNVMVGSFGEVQVMDWGLAKHLTGARAAVTDEADAAATAAETSIRTEREEGDATRAGSVLGTPAYMPPEQAIGAVDQLDARADVFGLGAVLCAVLTGKPPYSGGDAEATRQLAARAKLDDAFARLDGCGAEPELVALCKRCLAAEKADRPADAGAVAVAVAGLRAAAEERARQAELERVRAEAEAREQRRRRRAQLALLLAVGLLLAAGGAFAWWQDRQASERSARLARNADALAGLLDGGTDALRAGDADRADALLQEAARRLPEGGGDDLQARLDACRADLAVLRDLDAVDQFRWTWAENLYPDPKEVVARLRAALARFGLVPGQTPADEAARRVAASAVRDRLVAALDRWLQIERSAALRAVLRAADPDAYRDAVRDSNGAELAALLERAEALAQPPGFLAVLGENRAVSVERRRALLRAAVGRRPGDLHLLMGLGSTYPINQRHGVKERVRWFQAAVAAYPRNVAANSSLGIALGDMGDLGGAVAAFQEALRLDPNYTRTHSNLGVALRDKGDLDGAFAAFKEALRLDPKFAPAHSHLGVALRAKGDLDGAITAFKEALRLDPKFAPAHNGLGNALRAKGDLDGAVAAFQEALRLDPKYAYAHNNLGNALRDKGDLGGAVAAYKEALRLDPKLAPAHNNLGLALRAKGDLGGAVAAYKEALRLDPKYDRARTNLRLAERLRQLLPRLPDIAAGRSDPKGPAEAVAFAKLCAQPFQRCYALAVRLYEKAFAADPKLSHNLAAGHRYNAACYAALTAAGKAKDDDKLASADRAVLRGKALGWLRVDLALRQKQAASANPVARKQAAAALALWLRDTDLNGLRPGADRTGWAPDEAAAWDRFWAEVRTARDLATISAPPAKKAP